MRCCMPVSGILGLLLLMVSTGSDALHFLISPLSCTYSTLNEVFGYTIRVHYYNERIYIYSFSKNHIWLIISIKLKVRHDLVSQKAIYVNRPMICRSCAKCHCNIAYFNRWKSNWGSGKWTSTYALHPTIHYRFNPDVATRNIESILCAEDPLNIYESWIMVCRSMYYSPNDTMSGNKIPQ